MPVVPNANNGAFPEASRRSYIASAPFNGALFTYTPPVLNAHGDIAVAGILAPIAGESVINAVSCFLSNIQFSSLDSNVFTRFARS